MALGDKLKDFNQKVQDAESKTSTEQQTRHENKRLYDEELNNIFGTIINPFIDELSDILKAAGYSLEKQQLIDKVTHLDRKQTSFTISILQLLVQFDILSNSIKHNLEVHYEIAGRGTGSKPQVHKQSSLYLEMSDVTKEKLHDVVETILDPYLGIN